MDGNEFVFDFGVLPALVDDYGYYLIKKDLEWLSTTNHTSSSSSIIMGDKQDNVRLADKKLGVVSTIDHLHFENGKLRIYIDTLRLFRMTSSNVEELGWFMGRTALATIAKYKLNDWVHDDYAIVGTDRVYKADKWQRDEDVRMIHRVRAVVNGRQYLDVVGSRGSLYPNLKMDYIGEFALDEEEKNAYQEICKKVCDVSVVWQCGVKRRRLLREKKIYSWDDPSFPSSFYQMVSSPSRIRVIDKMIWLSRQHDTQLLFPPKHDLLARFPFIGRDLSSLVFVDFETDFQKCIYMVGIVNNGNYDCHWADHLDPGSEKPLMDRVYSILSSYRDQGKILCYYVAEKSFWKERCLFHNMGGCIMGLFDDMVDLSHVFIQGPLIIRNTFNFKLKNIASSLYEMGYIAIKQPEGCHDGVQSVGLAREYFKTRQDRIKDILEKYNRFDCQVMCEIVMFLQKYYNIVY